MPVNYLDKNHVLYVLNKLKEKIGEKVDKEDGKGLSSNDLTNDMKTHYDSAYSHSTTKHAPSTAQENVIDGFKVNGTDVTPVNKKINLELGTQCSYIIEGNTLHIRTKSPILEYPRAEDSQY